MQPHPTSTTVYCVCGHNGRTHNDPADDWGSACMADNCACTHFTVTNQRSTP